MFLQNKRPFLLPKNYVKKGTILHLPVHEVVPGKYTPFHLTVLPSYTQLIDDKSHILCGR